MGAMSEISQDHQTHAEPDASDRPLTSFAWNDLVKEAASEAWQRTNLTVSYDTAYRVTDAVLRYAMPHRVPEVMR